MHAAGRTCDQFERHCRAKCSPLSRTASRDIYLARRCGIMQKRVEIRASGDRAQTHTRCRQLADTLRLRVVSLAWDAITR